jgi:hypothetical protein
MLGKIMQRFTGTILFPLPELPVSLLERKINLCTELLAIADILDPGATRLRGVLLYGLQAAMVVRAKRDLASDTITKTAAQVSCSERVCWLPEGTQSLRQNIHTGSFRACGVMRNS